MQKQVYYLQCFLLILLTISNESGLRAQQTNPIFDVDRKTERLTFQQGLFSFQDTSEHITADQLVRQPDRYPFKAVASPVPVVGPKPVWVKFSIRNRDNRTLPVWIELDYPYLDQLSSYVVHQNHLTALSPPLSWRTPFASRPVDNRDFILPINLPPQQEYTVYLRIQRDFGPLNVSIKGWRPRDFLRFDRQEEMFWGGVVGWTLAATCLSLFLFLARQGLIYGLYCFYALCNMGAVLTNDGLFGRYYLMTDYVGGDRVRNWFILIAMGSCFLFVRSLLNAKAYLPPLLNRICLVAIKVWAAFAILVPILEQWLYRTLPTEAFKSWIIIELYIGIAIVGVLLNLLTSTLGYALFQKNVRGNVWLYLIAVSPFMFITVGWFITVILPVSTFGFVQIKPVAVSIVFETTVLLLGLTYRFKTYHDERERLLREQNQLALRTQLAERERLARDLHDHIGPDMVSLKLQLEAALDDNTDTLIGKTLSRVITQADRIVADVRQVSHALMPTDLQQQGLVASLYDYVSQLNGRVNEPEISFTHILTEPLPEFIQQPLLQIAKELINNALKHAEATIIDIELYQTGQTLCLNVSDNGCGYNPNQLSQKSTGIGLRNVRTVVHQLHGKLTIDEKPTGGMVHQIILKSH
ncbi:sensor histidine kinase [Spirosoma aerolatum]|uniref:sensor histidine kinase n=1 Tax=Spirosoma aerolatum TaxID=1211326 RepID=UPI0009AEACFF|nr:7TM-DISM domain-containing protein [Spirosoma aerolatum]